MCLSSSRPHHPILTAYKLLISLRAQHLASFSKAQEAELNAQFTAQWSKCIYGEERPVTHIWWGCPSLRGYLRLVLGVIHEITDTPKATFLFIFNVTRATYRKVLTRHLLLAAKTAISLEL